MRSISSIPIDADRFDARDPRRHGGAEASSRVASHTVPTEPIGPASMADDAGRPPAGADLARLMPVFERLVEETVTQVRACPAKPDPTFEGFEELLAPIRSATTLEGALLERGIAAVCQTREDLVVVALENPLPVLAEARAFLRRNDWAKASALRLASEVHTREFYRPDLLVVDGREHRALILDIKRSIASHKPKVLSELRSRMMAVALVARDWLERECDAPAVERVEIAIIDGSGDPADHEKAVFAIADLDRLLGIEGAGAAIGALRRLYAGRIREVLLPRCRRIVGVAAGSTRHSQEASAGATDAAPYGQQLAGEAGSGGAGSHEDAGGVADQADRTLDLPGGFRLRATLGSASAGFDDEGGAADPAASFSGLPGDVLRGGRFGSGDSSLQDGCGAAVEAAADAGNIGRSRAALRHDPRVSVGIASLGGRS